MTGNQKKIIIAALTILISIWHYGTQIHHPFLHILHRELYLIPIGLAAFWYGSRGGLLTAVIAIIVFLPRTMVPSHVQGTYHLNNLLIIPTFLLLGYFVGKYQDVRKHQFTTLWTDHEQKVEQVGRKNVLLCIDNSENAFKAARYVADHFSANKQMVVTIMGFIREPSQELFSDSEEYTKARADIEENIANQVDYSKEALLNSGFPPDAVKTAVVKLQKESIAWKILEEQKQNQFGTIVIGGARMSKTEEFVLGNKAVKLVREADCPVLTVY